MRLIPSKLKPASGFAYFFHIILICLLPIIVYTLVVLNFVQLALSIVVLSKWRMFAVKPRFWASNIRANAVDLMVGLSIVIFMTHSATWPVKLLWAVLYGVWLLFIKPAGSILMISTQAFLGQLCALMALFLVWAAGPTYGLTLLAGLFCFLAARHFLDSFDEPYARTLAYIWGYFGAALTWLLSHWLLFYRVVAQPTLLLSVVGYGLAILYYLDHSKRLNPGLRRQIVFVMVAIVVVIVAFSDWGNKVV